MLETGASVSTMGPIVATSRAEEDLLTALARGEKEALPKLIEQHAGLVRSSCQRALGKNHAMLDDAVQAVFLILLRKAKNIRSSAALASWLHSTAHRVCWRIRRGDRRRQRHEQEAVPMSQAVESNPELSSDLDAALRSLTLKQREIVLRHYVEGQPHSAIAGDLGISEVAAKKRAADGMANLRTFFSHRGRSIGATALVAALGVEASTENTALISGSTSAAATNLALGVVKTMYLKSVIAVATAIALVIGAGVGTSLALSQAAEPLANPPASGSVAKSELVPEISNGGDVAAAIGLNLAKWRIHLPQETYRLELWADETMRGSTTAKRIMVYQCAPKPFDDAYLLFSPPSKNFPRLFGGMADGARIADMEPDLATDFSSQAKGGVSIPLALDQDVELIRCAWSSQDGSRGATFEPGMVDRLWIVKVRISAKPLPPGGNETKPIPDKDRSEF